MVVIPLCVSFIPLVCLGCLQGGVGGGCLELLNGRGSWNPRFTRTFSDWEVDEVERFLLCMHGKRMLRDEEDMVL